MKSIKDSLLTFKENDEEEKKKELNIILKQQAFEKSKKVIFNINQSTAEVEKYNKSEYFFLMNTSGHVVTRNQLNQISKTTIPTSNSNQPINTNVVVNNKQQIINEEEKKKQKIEKERQERQKRLDKRNKILERVIRNDKLENTERV